ncbi:MAG: carboxymuconolactone decarboxylase family protein [bacterium]|nr:carboxymuconolactone decarboxylase family protein [bacterium]
MRDNRKKEETGKNFTENESEQNSLKKGLRDYRRKNPEFAKAFMEYWRKSKEGVSIPVIYKELMELAITIVQRCKPCIFLHTRLCIESGATIEQIMETTQIAVVMGGAPSYQYLGYVMEAIELYGNKEE